MHSEKPITYALHTVSQMFHQRRHWSSSNVRLMDDGPLSSFQGRLSNDSSFHAPLLKAIDGVVSWDTGCVSSSSTLQIFRDASHLWWLLCPPIYLLGHFPSFSVKEPPPPKQNKTKQTKNKQKSVWIYINYKATKQKQNKKYRWSSFV